MPSFVLITSLNLYFSREGKLLQVKQQEAEQNSFVGFVSFFANLQDYQGALQYQKYLRFIFYIVIVEGPSSVLLGYYVTRSSDISKESTKMLSRYNKKVSERKSGRILHKGYS